MGPETIHADIFVSRVLVPTFDLLENVIKNIDTNTPFDMKFLQITFHDTNLSNLLRFLKYFDTYGFEKFVRFSSSLRIELLKDINDKEGNSDPNNYSEYRFRVNFDNEDLQLPFCTDLYCSYDEFMKYMRDNLVFDYGEVEKYCDGKMGSEYTNELKAK